MQTFEHFFDAAIAEWPERLELNVVACGPVYVVEGLASLQERLSANWANTSIAVLMRNMHWAISAVANRAFETRDVVVIGDLSKDAIQDKFEADLNVILHRSLNWSAADIAAIKAYVAGQGHLPLGA